MKNSHMPEWKKANAKRMRRKPTKAEAALWQLLRCRRIGGTKFRRQAPMLGYIADFYAPSARLVIEVDGGYHQDAIESDVKRDSVMSENGLTVLRFTNEQVLNTPESVCQAIITAANL